MGYRHIAWNDEWIVENYLHYPSYKDMVEDHNRLFHTEAKAVSMKAHARTLGLRKPRKGFYYTPEQIEWLKENYPKYGCRKTAEMFNEIFGMSKSAGSMKNFGQRYGIKVDENVAIANKVSPAHCTGSKRSLKPAGSTRMECGRLVMKTEDGTWKSAGRAVWEKENGEVPEGFVVTHLDGDTTNVDLDNLVAVPVRYMGLLARNGMRSENKEITRAGVLWCDLYEALQLEEREMRINSRQKDEKTVFEEWETE